MSGLNEREMKNGGQRGRPDHRSLQDRQHAILEVFHGKATIVQIARRLGVRPETVAGWRDAALAGIDAALMWGDGPTEREIEVENYTLQVVLTRNWPPSCDGRSHDLDCPRSGGKPSRAPGRALLDRVDGR